MTTIEADNAEIEKHLINLVDLVEEGGGGIHSNILLRARDGDLSVSTKEPIRRGGEIIRLTRKILLPSDQYIVGVKGDEFTLDFPKQTTLTTLQKKLAENMIALYNATDKVALHKKYSFLLSIKKYPEVLDYIVGGRNLPAKFIEWIAQAKEDMDQAALNDFVVDTFLKTRYLGYNDHIRMSNVSIVMPVIDFLNHNWSGASFAVGRAPRTGDIIVNNSQPVKDSAECFAFYGPMDSLDTLIRYDFIDVDAPVIRSVPIKLNTPDGGVIDISGAFSALVNVAENKNIADLHLYVPTTEMSEDGRHLTVTHVFVPYSHSPLAMRRVLHYLLQQYFGKDEGVDVEMCNKWVLEAERKIIDVNVSYYEGLLSLLGPLLSADPENIGLQNVKGLADLQLQKLMQYQCLEMAA